MDCCSDLRVFVELHPVRNSYIHTLGTDMRVRDVGTAVFRVESSGKQVRLHNVLYVPGAPKWCAIISMGQLQSQRAVTHGVGDYMTMTLEDETQILGRRKTTAGLVEALSSHLLPCKRSSTLSKQDDGCARAGNAGVTMGSRRGSRGGNGDEGLFATKAERLQCRG
jgi:hypothetical protein